MIDNVILFIICWFWIKVLLFCVFFVVDISRHFHCCPFHCFHLAEMQLVMKECLVFLCLKLHFILIPYRKYFHYWWYRLRENSRNELTYIQNPDTRDGFREIGRGFRLSNGTLSARKFFFWNPQTTVRNPRRVFHRV